MQDVQSFAEIRRDGRLNDFARRLGHESAHARELADLLFGPPGSGVRHDVNGVKLAGHVLRFHGLEHFVGNEVGHVRPDGDHLVVALAVGDGALLVLLLDVDDLLFSLADEFRLFSGDDQVIDADRDAGLRRVEKAEGLDFIEELDGGLEAKPQIAIIHQRAQSFPAEEAVDERHLLRKMVVEDDASDGRIDELVFHRDGFRVQDVLVVVSRCEVDDPTGVPQANGRKSLDFAGLQSQQDFIGVGEGPALALGAALLLREIVNSEHDVLGRNSQRLAVCRRQDVARGQHQHRSLNLRFGRKRDVNGHLVAVKVGVERGADQRMDLDGLAFDQRRLKGLDPEAVERRRAVEQDRMVFDDFFKDVPDHRLLPLDHLLGSLDGGALSGLLQPVIDERLEELERHLFRQAALVQSEVRAYDNNRPAGIVHALSEQVLAEAPLLSFQGVGKRLQRPVVRAAKDATAAAVVEQSVNRLLQHALFVAHDHVRSVKFHQLLQPVVPVDDPAVEVVQVGSGEAPSVERHQGAELRGNHRDDVEDHPLRLVPGFPEGFEHFQALGILDPFLLRGVDFHFFAQLFRQRFDLNALQQLFDGLGPHAGAEFSRMLLLELSVALFGQELLFFQGRVSGVDDDEGFEVEDSFEVAERNVQEVADAAGQALEEPHVGARRGEFNVPQPLAADLRERHLHAALVANDAPVLHALIFSAQALPVRHRSENPGAEKSIPLRLEGPVVDGLRLGDFAVRPGPDFFRRRQTDADGVELTNQADSVIRVASKQCFPPPTERTKFPVPRSTGCPALPACSRRVAEALLGPDGRDLFFRLLDQLHIQTEALELAYENVERFGNARLDGGLAFHDGFVNLCSAVNVV